MLSAVIPARHEVTNLIPLIAATVQALRGVCRRERAGQSAGFEVLVIDDASTDQTRSVLQGLAALYPELRALVLARGIGQSGALLAGIRTARGDWIVTIDADLQNDPADIPRLWNALPGHDAALGVRVKRRDVWSRRVISRWANRLRNAVFNQSVYDTGCSLRTFPRKLALRLPAFQGMHRFFGPLLLREGCRLVQVPVHHRPRQHGRSHYNVWNRSVQVVIDLFGVAWLTYRPISHEVECSYGLANGTGKKRNLKVLSVGRVCML